jgi:hypothetical protein
VVISVSVVATLGVSKANEDDVIGVDATTGTGVDGAGIAAVDVIALAALSTATLAVIVGVGIANGLSSSTHVGAALAATVEDLLSLAAADVLAFAVRSSSLVAYNNDNDADMADVSNKDDVAVDDDEGVVAGRDL